MHIILKLFKDEDYPWPLIKKKQAVRLTGLKWQKIYKFLYDKSAQPGFRHMMTPKFKSKGPLFKIERVAFRPAKPQESGEAPV